MPKKEQLIEQLKRCLKQKKPADKYIKKLRSQKALDMLLTIGETDMTLLMYYVRENQLTKVKELLTGENPANPLIKNQQGINALILAILTAGNIQHYDLAIIDELLKYNPTEQLSTMISIGSPLHIAVFYSHVVLVQKILAASPPELLFMDINTKECMPPLHLAIEKDNQSIVGVLLTIAPEKQLLQKNKDGAIPLHLALEKGNIEIIKKLLNYVVQEQLSQKTLEGDTVFDCAARSKNLELTNWLIETYPQILTIRSIDGFTPLHFAARLGNLSLVQQLLKKDAAAQVIAKDDIGVVPLAEACSKDFATIVKELLQYSPHEQITAVDNLGQNIFHICCLFGAEESLQLIIETAQKNNVDLTTLVLKKDNNDAIPIMAVIPLHYENSKKLHILKMLLAIDCIKQLEFKRVKPPYTPLILAVESNEKEIVQLFLEMGSAILLDTQKCVNQLGVTPLQHAILKEELQMVKLLLSYQTEQQIIDMNNSEMPPLLVVIYYKQQEMFQLLMESKFRPILLNAPGNKDGNAPLHMAIGENRNHQALRILIAKGADINQVNWNGWTPLHAACAEGYIEATQVLIQAGAKLDCVTKDRGDTPLHLAAGNGNLRVVKELLEHCVDINSRNNNGSTPLFLSVFHGYKEIVELLLKKGANANIPFMIMEKPITPLFLVFQFMNLKIAKILLKYGADVNLVIMKDGDKSLSILEYIKLHFSNDRDIYEKLQQLLPQLPKLPTLKEESTSTNNQLYTIVESALSPRNYLLSMGYSEELLEQFEAERQENKRLLKENSQKFKFDSYQKNAKEQEIITWLDGKLTSENESIFPIPSHNNVLMYGYLDERSLLEQECDPSKLSKRRFKFDGYHFKKLDANKGVYRERVKLAEDKEPCEVTYTHELKINKLDRVLFFSMQSDNSNACLFVGVRFLAGGLHTQAKINSLTASIKASNSYLEIKWPIEPQEEKKPDSTDYDILMGHKGGI